METTKSVKIVHFSDALRVWAYVAQIRVDELKRKFSSQIELSYHFLSLFGAVQEKISTAWKEKGGFAAYSDHVKGVAARFDHVEIHPEIWTRNIPCSSVSCHMFLKSIQILDKKGEIPDPTIRTTARSNERSGPFDRHSSWT